VQRQAGVVREVLLGLEEARDLPITAMLVFVDGDFSVWNMLGFPIDVQDVLIRTPKQMDRVVSGSGPVGRETIELIAKRLSARLRPA